MIEQIGAYLTTSTAAGIGTLGTDVFLNVIPETTRVTVAVFELAGRPASFALGGRAPAYTQSSIEIMVRSTVGPTGIANPTNARARIQRAWNRLSQVSNQTIGGSTYLRIEPESEPYLADRDEQGRVVFSAEFTVTRRGTTST
jgi:hypothetical protein